jgi:DNA-binding transcriptional ArsR family regulator
MALNACRTVNRIIRVSMVDMETGEPLQDWPAIQRERIKHYWGESFVTMFQEALKAVSGMNNAWKVLNQRELAAELRMSQPQVSRALRNLAEKQIITKGARMGRGHAYTLNPYFGWERSLQESRAREE